MVYLYLVFIVFALFMRSLFTSFLVLTLSTILVACSSEADTSSGATLEQGAQGIQAKSTNIIWGRYQDYHKDNVDTAMNNADKKFLIYSYSPSCIECRKSTLAIIKAFNTLKKTDVIGFRLTLGQDLAFEKEHKMTVPGTLVLMKGTEELARKKGELTEADILGLLK